jgi:hypothetical protein
MKASEFGQSLLSDIRERNQEEQRRAEKRAKRDSWKQLGLKVAMNVAEDIVSQRHQNLLYNEGVMANKLLIDTVHNETSDFTSQIKAADEFVGGRDAYLRNELDASADAYLKTLYPAGTYNANQFNSLKSTIVDGYFDKYKEAFTNREKANKEFIASGNREAYFNNIKALKGDGTIGSSITQLIKKIPGISALTGNVNSDLHTANTEILAKTNKLQQYQEAYRKTKNAELSKYIVENLPDEGLGTPAAEVSDTYETEINTGFGKQKVRAVDVKTTDVDGNVQLFQQILSSRGVTSLGPSQRDALADFASNASALKPEQYAVGERTLLELEDIEAQGYADALDQYVKERNNTSPSNKEKYNDETKLIKTNAAKNIAAAGIYAVSQGWGTAAQGRAVALQVIKDDLKQETPELDNFVLGSQAPFRTALAINSTIKSQAKNAPSPHDIATVLSNVSQMYQSYKDMNITQRDALKSALEKENYFEGKIQSGLFKNNFDSIVNAVEKVKEHQLDVRAFPNVSLFLDEVDKRMEAAKMQKPKDSEAVEDLDLVKPAEVKRTGRVSRTSSEYKNIAQNREYKKVIETQKLLNKIKNERETTYKNYRPTQYKLLLDRVENTYNKLYKEYQDMYGSINQDSLLAP